MNRKSEMGMWLCAGVAIGLAGCVTVRTPCAKPEPLRGIELVEILRRFSRSPETPDNRGIDWTTLAEADTPIDWVTRERYGDIPASGIFSRYSAARHGSVMITLDGKPAHEQFLETVRPAVWEISIYGCMATVECVELKTDGSAYNEEPDIEGALGAYAELVARHPDDRGEGGGTFVGRLYRVTLPGRGPGWLVESRSIGNHTWSLKLTYFPGESALPLAEELIGLL